MIILSEQVTLIQSVLIPMHELQFSNIKIHLVKKVQGKAIPLQTWTGSEGSRRFRLPHFKTIGTLMC